MSYDEERQRRSRVVVETPTARREEYVTQTRRVPPERGGYSTGIVAAVALTAIALTALLVFFLMNRGTDATQTNVNVSAATAATPLPTQPPPVIVTQPTPMPQQPIIVQAPPTTTTQPPVIVNQPAPPPTTAGATTAPPADDSAIESRVNKAFNNDADLATLGLTVTVIDGKATLNGLVKTADQKAHAEQLARAARGVKSVDNKIIVEGQ